MQDSRRSWESTRIYHCESNGKRLLIQCKRPFFGLLSSPTGPRGVVAISLSKVLNSGDRLFVYSGEAAGREGLHQHLLSESERCKGKWADGRLGGRIVGILFHAIAPSIDEEVNLYVVAQQLNVHLLATTDADASAFRAAFKALEEGDRD